MKALETWKKNKCLIFVIAVFIVSRIIYYFCCGVRFDTGPLSFYWQYIDPYLLKTDLLRSVYYLHSQPPLFNLFLGMVLKFFPDGYGVVFLFCYLFLGFLLAVSLFKIMAECGISAKLSALLTSLFIISPSVILYENYLFYEYPVMVLLCLSLLFLIRFLKTDSIKYGVVLFSQLAVIVLTRGIFHILWFIAAAWILICLSKKENKKKIMFAFMIPFIIVFSVYIKNFCIFRIFSMGSVYVGQNIAKMTVLRLPKDTKEALFKNGKTSALSFIDIFSPISAYRPYVHVKQPTGIPVLDQEYKSSGAVNAHNIGYIEISRIYLRDALYAMKNYPVLCLKLFWRDCEIKYFLPATNTWPFNESYNNYEKMRSFDRIYSLLFYGQQYYFGKPYFLLAGIPFLFGYGVYLTLKSLFEKHDDFTLAPFLLFTMLMIITVTFISVFSWENPRFRFLIDPFYLIIFGFFLNNMLKKRNIKL
jgi:hypothetical protein